MRYKASVSRDLKHLDKSTALRIMERIESDLADNPEKGAPLSGKFKGLYRYGAGDYRVIYAVSGDSIIVLRIGHRSRVYR